MRKLIPLLAMFGALALAGRFAARITVGKQSDGSFVVATGQRLEPGTIAFDGRPMDLALHPGGELIAVLNQNGVFLADRGGVFPDSNAKTAAGASYRGCLWSPDGERLFVSLS